MDKKWIAILVESLIIIILGGIIIFGKVGPEIKPVDVQPQRDSIDVLVKQRAVLEVKMNSLNNSYDSLVIIKNKIKNAYHEKIHIIYSDNPTTLDSIIRKLSDL